MYVCLSVRYGMAWSGLVWCGVVWFLSVCLSACLSVGRSVGLSVCLSVCVLVAPRSVVRLSGPRVLLIVNAPEGEQANHTTLKRQSVEEH